MNTKNDKFTITVNVIVFMEPVSAPALLRQVGKTPRQTQPATRPGAQNNYSLPTDHT